MKSYYVVSERRDLHPDTAAFPYPDAKPEEDEVDGVDMPARKRRAQKFKTFSEYFASACAPHVT